jgi:murein DD-endopeptidase MepM/ murein hydrolase activator NlpD
LPVTQYKKIEKDFADRIGSWLRRARVAIAGFFKYVTVKGKQRFTVMLIPHSEKKIFNFQISFFTLIFVTCTLGIVLVGFFLLATNFTYTNELNVRLTRERDDNIAQLSSLKDEIASIRTAGKKFKSSLDNALVASGIQVYKDATGTGGVGASFLTPDETERNNLKEISDLKNMGSLLENSREPLDRIGKILTTYKGLMANVPTLWPLKGARGNITTRFGWTIHPFTHNGYSHNGVDIAWGMGTPVVATANGKITQTGFTLDLGNYVTIQHKYGFYTKYAHLSAFAKRRDDNVNQGDIIGYLGDTGLSTGPHLHYEVRLGSEYRDPMAFLSLASDISSLPVGGRSSD